MKVQYNGKVYETQEFKGLIVSSDRKLIFGRVGEPLKVGAEVVEDTGQVSEEEESAEA